MRASIVSQGCFRQRSKQRKGSANSFGVKASLAGLLIASDAVKKLYHYNKQWDSALYWCCLNDVEEPSYALHDATEHLH